MKELISKHPSLQSVLQLAHPSQLLVIFHAYAVYTFLTQYFDIPNADDLINSISRDIILDEKDWMNIIRKNCPHFDEYINSTSELRHFEEQFHTFFSSIPTNIDHYYQGESSKINAFESVIDMCL